MEHEWKTLTLRIADVRERGELQMRVGGVGLPHVRKMLEAVEQGAVLPPITVARIGELLCVVDGFHRLEVARRYGAEVIQARVASMDLKAALAEARRANAEHDLAKRRTNADRNNVWENYYSHGEHLDRHGICKGAGAIRAELGNLYSRETVRLKLKARGVELNNEVDFPHGFKPYRGGERGDDDEGEDFDDVGAGVGPLEAEYAVEVREHLDAIDSLYFSFTATGGHKGKTVGAVRELLDRLVANVAPVATEVAKLDI